MYYHFIGNNFTNEITDRNTPSVNLLSVSPFVIKSIITDGFTDRKGMQKKFYPLHSIGISLGKMPYVIPLVIILKYYFKKINFTKI